MVYGTLKKQNFLESFKSFDQLHHHTTTTTATTN